MFLKIRNIKGKQYIALTRSYRKNGKTHHQHICTLGSVDTLRQSGQLQALTKKFNQLSKVYDIGIHDIGEIQATYCYGDVIYRKIWEQYQYHLILQTRSQKTKHKFNVEQTAYWMVIDRLLSPQSRLALWKKQSRYLNIQKIPLHHFYRTLDFLAGYQEAIQQHSFARYTHLFNREIDVVFYDVTTFHFESMQADELRQFGFSKSQHFNEVQVVMGLLIDQEGHPIGFNLFPGNTSEANTFLAALDTLKQRYSIHRVIIVADKGLHTNINLHRLREAGYEYIVSARIKSMSKDIQKKILDKTGYKKVYDKYKNEVFYYHRISNVEHRFKDKQGDEHFYTDDLIVTWSEKRAAHDRKERERLLAKAKENYEKGISINGKRGWKRYLKTDDTSSAKATGIDESRVKADEQWDGYNGICVYTKKPMDEKDIISHIHRLWTIEESFRVYKTTLEAEPVFVWTPKRIVGHFVVCFMALVLERTLERRLRDNQMKASPAEIREALNAMEVAKIKIGEQEYYLKKKYGKLSSTILKIFRVNSPKTLTAVEDAVI